MQRNADRSEYLEAFEGLDFPTSKPAIVRKAADTGGLDNEVLFVLENLEDRTYQSPDDILADVERVYAATDGLAGGVPAAPSEAGPRLKRVIEQNADPRAGERA